MNKSILVIVFFLFPFSIFGQTWTVRNNLGGEIGDVDYEYVVITKEQYDRLLRQKTALGEYSCVDFIDALEKNRTGRVIRGTRPNLNGYYYLVIKITAITDRGKQLLSMLGIASGLGYGNSNTGDLAILFVNYLAGFIDPTMKTYLLGSDEFNRVYYQCIRFVNGE